MLSKSRIKLIRSLRLSKYREQHGLFIVEGDKLVREALDQKAGRPMRVDSVYAIGEWLDKNQDLTVHHSGLIQQISSQELKQASGLKTPNQVLALVEIPEKEHLSPETAGVNLVLALENVQDPGNMGTIIRLADWFSIGYLVISTDSADPFSPKVVQASMGSIFRVRVFRSDLPAWIGSVDPTLPVYGTSLDGLNIYKTDLSSKRGVLIFGNESKGISEDLMNMVKKPLTIPRPEGTNQGPDSLNVSLAAAIVLSEFTRNNS
jgi:TrmH family RNA methyltransferase